MAHSMPAVSATRDGSSKRASPFSAPQLTLPKGGGAIRGIGGNFSVRGCVLHTRAHSDASVGRYMDTLHDAFISYKSEYLSWVEVLARNLRRLGIEVPLDEWHRRPGDRVSGSLQAALDASRAGVLVVTPEAAASGWVQDEFDRMRHLQRTRPDFRLVPVILRETPKFAFRESLFTVDFRDALSEAVYRRKLHELVCGIRGLPPGDGTVSEPEIEVPRSLGAFGGDTGALTDADAADGRDAPHLFNALLDDLEFHHIAAVFAQEGAQHLVPLDRLLV
jgi:hypothetical protein